MYIVCHLVFIKWGVKGQLKRSIVAWTVNGAILVTLLTCTSLASWICTQSHFRSRYVWPRSRDRKWGFLCSNMLLINISIVYWASDVGFNFIWLLNVNYTINALLPVYIVKISCCRIMREMHIHCRRLYRLLTRPLTCFKAQYVRFSITSALEQRSALCRGLTSYCPYWIGH